VRRTEPGLPSLEGAPAPVMPPRPSRGGSLRCKRLPTARA
jgi:hypothetical protein